MPDPTALDQVVADLATARVSADAARAEARAALAAAPSDADAALKLARLGTVLRLVEAALGEATDTLPDDLPDVVDVPDPVLVLAQAAEHQAEARARVEAALA